MDLEPVICSVLIDSFIHVEHLSLLSPTSSIFKRVISTERSFHCESTLKPQNFSEHQLGHCFDGMNCVSFVIGNYQILLTNQRAAE